MSDDTAELVRGQTALAARLVGLLGRAPGNLVYSPFSISAVLQSLAIAARGETASERLGALGISMPERRIIEASADLLRMLLPSRQAAVELRVVNDLWIQHGQEVLFVLRDRKTGTVLFLGRVAQA
ncbi:MAG TPA: serpin family protein [Myxococcaceae bacterium]|nr:serpin family protein [Myxococcaceae bacterium]